jgi:hypothetical protein
VSEFIIEAVERLEIHPGETLVATVNYRMTMDEVESLTAKLRQVLPNGVEVLVKTNDIEFEVVASVEEPR